MDFLPEYDDLWVVSDIHMGGELSAERNFQILREGRRLANFVRRVAADRPEARVALVLNGDIIDSLAEDCVPGYAALDVETAFTMLQRISTDASFAPVWEALAEFVGKPNRHLFLVIGNHDIELALGPVQAWIRNRLAAGDANAAGRILFSTRGEGFGCRVGGKRVFCTHGNEVDLWNTVDYNALGQLDNAINAGRRINAADWTPNAGTRMVIDLMNEVKARYPFVDLLKPEIKSVLGIILALEPSLATKVVRPAYAIGRDLVRGNSVVSNLLGVGETLEDDSPATLAALSERLLGDNLARAVRTGDEDQLLLVVERDIANGKPAVDALYGAEGATLGFSDIVSSWFGRVTPAEGLRNALKDWFGGEKPFELTEPDSTFTGIIKRVGPSVDFVVTGHTHLARSIEFGAGGHYFNCGTWIRIVRLTPQVLDDPKAFEGVFNAFKQRTMEALDQEGSLLLDRTNAVHIFRDGSNVSAQLLRVVDSSNKNDVAFKPEKGGIAG